MWHLRAPVGGEVAPEGRREHRLPEPLQQGRDGVQRLLGAAASGLQGLQLGNDSALLRYGGKRNDQIPQVF